MHPRRLRCSSLKYSRYSRSSRLAGRAPRPSRCDAGLSPRWYGLLPVPMRHDAASADARQRNQEETEMDATTVAVDVAKTVFEVAIANREWHIVARHRFNRRQFTQFLATASPTHVVMEACGTAHFWG